MTVSFNLKPGAALGDVVSTRCRISPSRPCPIGITTDFQGAAKAFESSLGNLWVLLIVAILVVYIVLGILYESYIHPLTILSGLPSAGFGALITLYLFHMDLNIYAFVGLIMLIGIVEKNAIMQIDFALEAERNQGLTPMKAIYEGCLIRFRPIMMTTMAALLGAVPIALGLRRGRRSAAAARPGGGRRPAVLAIGDALLDAGVLHLHGRGAREDPAPQAARQASAARTHHRVTSPMNADERRSVCIRVDCGCRITLASQPACPSPPLCRTASENSAPHNTRPIGPCNAATESARTARYQCC